MYVGKARSKSPKKSDANALNKRLVRKPNPPRQVPIKRALTGKQLDDIKQRNPITAEELNNKHNVPIMKPEIKPDKEIEQKLLLDKYTRT